MSRHLAPGTAAGLVLVVSFGAVACAPTGDGPSASAAGTVAVDTELVSVTRQDVTETAKLETTVGNGSLLVVPIDIEGIVTWAPAAGARLASGDVLIEVGNRPVMLVVGESPLYRPLRMVGRSELDEAGTRLGAQTGPDVAQLQQFLLDQGFDDKGRLAIDETFGLSTERAVKDWQKSVGHPATGVIDSSQLLFMPHELLVSSKLNVGEPFDGLDVTGTDTLLTSFASTAKREFFPVGTTVEVLSEPPTTGVVVESSRVSLDGEIRQRIEIAVDGAARDDLGESVQVVGSVTRAEDVLTIPVRALLALSDGGWSVETGLGSRSEPVTIELIDVVGTTAIVQGLNAGDEVVVPL